MSALVIIGWVSLVVNVVCLTVLELRLRASDREFRATLADLALAKTMIADRDDKLFEEERLLRAAAARLAAHTAPP